MGTDGSVAYLFNKLGVIHITKSYEEDFIMEVALEAGAEDFVVTDDYFEIITTPINLSDVAAALQEQDIDTLNAETTMRAETLVHLDQEASEKVLKIMNFMDDLDDVQEVHTNAEFPDDFIDEEA
jgi:transcriptional/translational regulatory protein YebC/TACO1